MWVKENGNWSIEKNYIDSEYFERFLNRLKTYSKCSNSSVYSVTNTLDDVYNILNYQHAFWVQLTNLYNLDSIELEGIVINKNTLYNLSLFLTEKEILESEKLRFYLENGTLKSANSVLFEEDPESVDFFETLEPIIEYVENNSTSGSGSGSRSVSENIIWMNGTDGVNGTQWDHMLIRENFNESDWLNQYQTSDIDNGYTIRNVFTSEKVLNKLLSNYNLIDLTTNGNNIELFTIQETPQSYSDLEIDNQRAVNGQRILLKDQNNPIENGIYLFENNILTRDHIFSEPNDLDYFSVFTKEGNNNKNKEFFLDRYQNGRYPTLDEPKTFSIGENFAIRNRSSYRLLANHVLNDSFYFTQKDPIIDFNYSDKIFINGGTDGFYEVSDDQKSIIEFDGTNGIVNELVCDGTSSILRDIQLLNDEIYLVKNNESSFSLNKLYIGDRTNSIFGEYEHIYEINGYLKDYEIISNNSAIFLTKDSSTDTSTDINIINYNTNTNQNSIIKNIDVPFDANEITYISNGTDDIIFYTTNTSINMFYNENFIIKNIKDVKNIQSRLSGGLLEISWLVDDRPEYLNIDINKLSTQKDWNKGLDYELDFFSKTKIDNWEVSNNELYLKDVQITNLGTNFTTDVPKISNEPNRYYDGVDDFSILPNDSINLIKGGNGSFTSEFRINPDNLRPDQPVMFYGESSRNVEYEFFSFTFSFDLPPYDYITFYVNSDDDFPYFVVAKGNKVLEIKSNKKLNIGTETHVSFTWSYSTNKVTARLYFDGDLVGTTIDQRTITNGITTNRPIDIRTINFNKNFLGKSEINSIPFYEGSLSEVRLWDVALNSSQVATRAFKSLSNTDILYSNLKGYWGLNDANAFHSELTNNYDGTFFGGLNLDKTLIEINSPQQIQLSDEVLFISDKIITENFSSIFDGSDLDEFETDYTTNVIPDPLNTSEPNDVLFLNNNEFGATKKINVFAGDIIEVELDVLYFNNTSGSGINESGLLFYNLSDTNGFLQKSGETTPQWFSVNSNVPDSYEKIGFIYTIPNDLTTDGTTIVDPEDITLEINQWVTNDTEPSYFDNLRIKITRKTPINDIYTIDLNKEEVNKIYSTKNSIDSIYLEKSTNMFYFLEQDDIIYYNKDNNSFDIVYGNGLLPNNNLIDFMVVESDVYYLKQDYNIHDSSDNVLYNGSNFSSLDLIYGKKQTDINSLNLYWKTTNGEVNILSDDFNNVINGIGNLSWIGGYPFINNKELTIESSKYIVFDRKILKDGIDLDSDNKLWSLNLKSIWGIYERNNNLIIGTRDLLNNVVIWEYDTKTGESIVFMDLNGNSVFINSVVDCDLVIYENNESEYFLLLSPIDQSIIWFKIERQNKIVDNFIPWKKSWSGDNIPIGIEHIDNSNIWILLNNNEQLYISSLTNISTDYDIFNNKIDYITDTRGIVVGESGLLFNDTFENPWKFNLQNLIIKDDFLDIEVYIEKSNRDLGYKVDEWSNYAWITGKQGTLLRTINSGSDWEVLNTDTFSDLNSVSFMSEKIGLIVGDNNIILSTFSGGDSFIPVNVEQIGFRNWNKVIIYKPDNAIIIGNSGTMIHLSRNDERWDVDRILNNKKLDELEIQVKNSDLEDSIALRYNNENQTDVFIQNILDIKYLGNDKFIFSGENDLIGVMELSFTFDYIKPNINFLSSGIFNNWEEILPYVDIANNKNKAFLLSGKDIYNIEWDRFELESDNNVHSVDLDLFDSNDENIRHIEFWDNNYLVSIGDRADVLRHKLFSENGMIFEEDYNREDQSLSEFFKPRLLFLDYYMGRKINIHLEEGGYEIPKGNIDKKILDCFKFNPQEYIMFNDFGTVKNQNNFLAYQDMYYLNRRVLDGGVNTWGKIQTPYKKYNKKITAVSNSDYNNMIWNGLYVDTELDLLNSTSGSYRIFNESKTDLSIYTSGLREDSIATKIQYNPLSFTVNENDVINISILEDDKTLPLEEGNIIMLRVDNPVYPIQLISKITNDDLNFGIIKTDLITQRNMTAQDVESEMLTDALEAVNKFLDSMCLPPAISSEIDVKVNRVIISETDIVREYTDTDTQTITTWKLWNLDMIEDSKQGELVLTNLNYFNGDLRHLKQVFDNHYISDSYDLIINNKDIIEVTGKVTSNTQYYNLETVLEIGIHGSSGIDTHIVDVKYSEDVIYGATYNLETFLSNLDPVFVPTYEFPMPEQNYIMNNLIRTSNNEYIEVNIDDNKIYIGNDYGQILDFREGLFVDVSVDSNVVTRVYISKIEKEAYDLYPDKFRHIIYTDTELQKNLGNTGVLSIRTRNTLNEISNDLEFTDNIMFPLPNGGTNGVELFNKTYFTQMKTSSAYGSFILNDDNIRNNITAIMYLDDDNDWNMNVINWKDDPNFFYRPLDLHDVGIDRVFKKAITIDSSNYNIDGNMLSLVNVDRENYNYRLVDGLTVRELEEEYYWVLNADIRNSIIGQDEDGKLVWYEGDWICGTWEDGTWYSGTAYDIEWLNGEVFAYEIYNNFNLIEVIPSDDENNTTWFNATWGSGTWNNGVWSNGTWFQGQRFKGTWLNGTWKGGIWEDGVFGGGTWENGTWLNGTFCQDNTFAIWENGTWLGGDFGNGTWLNGIWDQTDRVASRFGTKASLLHNAVWEYGLWKNGEFHSGLTLNNNDESVVSDNYQNSNWKNGIWIKGDFYGGIWDMGRWNNGVFHNGLWKSDLNIEEMKLRDSLLEIEIKFTSKHYFKNINDEPNYFVILGEPEIEKGLIDEDVEFLGYNMMPQRHNIIEIIDDYTILIASDGNFPTGNFGTNGSDFNTGNDPLYQSSSISGFNTPIDMVYHKNNEMIYLSNTGDNNIKTIDIHTNIVNDVTGVTNSIGKIYRNQHTGDIYGINTNSNEIYVVDTNNNIVSNTITVESIPSDIVILDNQKVYSSNRVDNSISVIDPISYTSTRISVSIYEPEKMYVVGDDIYILCPSNNSIIVLDSLTNTISSSFVVSSSPKHITYDSDSDVVYVTYNNGTESATIIDNMNKTIINTFIIGGDINNIKYINETNLVYALGTTEIKVIKDGIILETLGSGDFKDIIYYNRFSTLFVLDDSNGLAIPIIYDNTHILDITEAIGVGFGTVEILLTDSDIIPTYDSLWVNDIPNGNITKIETYLNCDMCKDYTLIEVIDNDTITIPFEMVGYIDQPDVVSHWLDGMFERGIWEDGWFNNGGFIGGIWIDGVFENGEFGS